MAVSVDEKAEKSEAQSVVDGALLNVAAIGEVLESHGV